MCIGFVFEVLFEYTEGYAEQLSPRATALNTRLWQTRGDEEVPHLVKPGQTKQSLESIGRTVSH